ncbi:MAG TPA: phosphate signaling complex protein PhoU [Anaerolineales bacterium]|jgi:phosphate transport system protein|nr:phosphate signaling complex protein PhoU [Anaerolineales bacterium]
MTRETLERKLHELNDEVLLLGSMVEQATLGAVRALRERSLAASEEIYGGDEKINAKRFEIEERTITLIATQQPMARDLRILTAILEIITELERMGDYAKGIGRINLMMGPESRLKVSPDLLRMAEICVDMLHRSLEAFVTGNVELARSIPRDDDRVDELFNSIQSEIFQQMIANPKEIETINHLLWACHNLERLADRVTNICERTVFIATGDMLEFDRSDDERRKAFQGGL